jgi:hemerythrin
VDSFAWIPAFNFGIADIDEQNRELVALLNECEHTARHRAGGLDPAIVARLKAYVIGRFFREEVRLAAAGFEGLEGHRAQHQHFASRVAELETPARDATHIELANSVAFLRDWFVHHVLTHDRQYLSCLRAAEPACRNGER